MELTMIHSSRGVFEDVTLHPICALQQFFSQLCHAYYLAGFTLLCIIFVGSLWQGVGHTV